MPDFKKLPTVNSTAVALVDHTHTAAGPASPPYVWYDARQITGLADGAAVATWPDASGNGRDLTQPTGGERPTWETNAIGGQPAVRFNGAGQNIYSSDFGAQAQPVTIFVVAEDATATGTKMLLDGMGAGSATDRVLFYIGGTNAYNLGAGGDINGGTPNTSPHVFTVTFAATDTLRVDGIEVLTGNAGSNPLRGVTLGRYGESGILYWAGDIAEVIIYTQALTAAARQQVEASLAAKYAIGAFSLAGFASLVKWGTD